MRKAAVCDSLKKNGYRSTRTRDAVIEFLATQEYLISVEVIRESAHVDSVTAYRVLDVLEKLGIVYKMQSVAAYLVVPQDLRGKKHLMVMIDDQNKKISISSSPDNREGIHLERVVLELWGVIRTETSTEEAETSTGEIMSLSIDEDNRLKRF